MSACTCVPCGREFTTLAAFDRHQDIDYKRRPVIICRDPATIGLLQNSLGRWHFPVDARSRVSVTKMRAEKVAAHTSGTPQAPRPAESRGSEPQPEGTSHESSA